MLAQNFKSAADLGISEEEKQSLIKVLGLLDRRELVDVPQNTHCDNGFNMGTQGCGCGTPACIGGWVAALMGQHQQEYVDSYLPSKQKSEGITNLYWGVLSATVPQAAIALRSFLTIGRPCWRLALAEPSHD